MGTMIYVVIALSIMAISLYLLSEINKVKENRKSFLRNMHTGQLIRYSSLDGIKPGYILKFDGRNNDDNIWIGRSKADNPNNIDPINVGRIITT